MVKFEITYGNGKKKVSYTNPDNVRDRIFIITSDMTTSIDVENWCELATVGEKYRKREFTVEVIDDER